MSQQATEMRRIWTAYGASDDFRRALYLFVTFQDFVPANPETRAAPF